MALMEEEPGRTGGAETRVFHSMSFFHGSLILTNVVCILRTGGSHLWSVHSNISSSAALRTCLASSVVASHSAKHCALGVIKVASQSPQTLNIRDFPEQRMRLCR